MVRMTTGWPLYDSDRDRQRGRIMLYVQGVSQYKRSQIQDLFGFNALLKGKHWFWTVAPQPQNGFIFHTTLNEKH